MASSAGLRGKQPTEVHALAAAPQAESRLLSLPPEIRNRIYGYLFGSNVVHVRLRFCKAKDRPLPQWSEKDVPKKIGYAVCKHPHEWGMSYELSKKPEIIPEGHHKHRMDNGITSPSEHFLNPYMDRHQSCELPLKDFAYNDYPCDCSGTESGFGKKTYVFRCKGCATRLELFKLYPSLSDEMRKRHEDSTLHLGLLQTCRLVYDEACLLPYSLNTFDFDDLKVMEDFVGRLTEKQRMAIESVHLDRPKEAIARAVICLPKLESLSLSLDWVTQLRGDDRDWKKHFRLNKLEAVEVIYAWDNQVTQGDREPHRVKAERAEKFMMSSSLEQARAKLEK